MPNPDTFGWDTVFAMRLPLFNATIGAAKPADENHFSFASSGQGPPDRDLSWTFGRWQVDDAYGAQFTLSNTLQSGTLKGGTPDRDLAGGVCKVTANMVLKGKSDSDAVKSPTADAATAGQPWATVDFEPQTDIGFDGQLLAQQGLDSWFATAEGSKAFDDIFAGLKINTSATGKTSWIRPKNARLAGATLPDGSQAIGFLAMTASDSIIGASLELSPFAIPEKADASDKVDAAFLISPTRLLAAMIAPALPYVFGTSPDSVETDFPVLDGCRIRNTVPLSFPVKASDGKIYVAAVAVDDMTVELANDLLTITIQMSFGIDLGKLNLETINVRMVEQLKATLVSAPDDPDHRVLVLTQAADPIVQHDTEESLWALGGELLVGIVAAIAAGLILKFVPGGLVSRFGLSAIAGKIWAAVLAAVAIAIGMAISRIPDMIAEFETADLETLPNFSSLIDDALSAIEWPTPQRFSVDSVEFADCLRIGLKREASPTAPAATRQTVVGQT